MTTFANLKTYVQQNYSHASDSTAVAIQERIVNRAFRQIALDGEWSYWIEEGRVNFEAPQTTGTIAATKDSATFTLSGATWPTDAATDPWHFILSSNTEVEFEVKVRNSSTSVTAKDGQLWLDASVSGKTYTVYRREYSLPSNFRKFYFGQAEQTWWMEEVSPGQYKEIQLRQNQYSGDPRYMTVIQGTKMLVWPYPSRTRTFDFVYMRWPTLLSSGSDNMDFDEHHLNLVYAAMDVVIARHWGGGSPLPFSQVHGRYREELIAAKGVDSTRMHRYGRTFGFSGRKRRQWWRGSVT